ncbi:MAG TPA: SDR family NAD(P)-dependent oxidoreductase, partial [Candidatus Thermoplasmatota archaeon]
GFLAAGAATTKDNVKEAALPFDRRRHGMIIGMGAVGLVVEADAEVRARGMEPIVEIVASHVANSAYHGSRLDTDHVATEMDRLLGLFEERSGVQRADIAPKLLFMSHETYTPARGGSAAAEIEALRRTFGPNANKVVVSNTKGFTGHPMGASIEDAIAIKSLQRGRVPPIANLKEPDPSLGDLNLSKGGEYAHLEYALRLAAGFGSQIAFLLFKLRSKDEKRIVDNTVYTTWLTRMSGNPRPELEVVNRTLRIKTTMTQPLAVAPTQVQPPMPTAPAPPVAPPIPVPVPTAPKPPLPVPAASRALKVGDVQSKIIGLIAEKTGYPKEMLEPDLDLEADLGIDTVKQAELFGFVRDAYNLPREEGLQLKDYPTIAKITGYIVSRAGGAAGLATAATVALPTIAPVVTPIIAPAVAVASAARPVETMVASAASKGEILAKLLGVVAERTGYPKDMLDPNLDLEADLGIDTVKQAEIFGLIRESYELPRDENLQLKDYPTLDKIAGYVAGQLTGRPAPTTGPTTAVTPVAAASTPTPHTTPPPTPAPPTTGGWSIEQLQARVIDVMAEKTGYPKDMLDPNLDLEADLGIDTVKQAELFGIIREAYNLPREENLQLKDYPTIGKLAGYIHSRLNGPAPASLAPVAPAPTPPLAPTVAPTPAPPMPPAAAAVTKPTLTSTSGLHRDDVVQKIRGLISEKTGYPPELLEEDLDLEADLGIDTVKQAELFGFVRETFQIARRDDIQLSNYSTLGKVADFVLENVGKPATAAAATDTASTVTSSTNGVTSLHRYAVHYTPVSATPTSTMNLQKRTLVVWAPPSLRADLLHELSRNGATGVPIDALPTSFDEAKSVVDNIRRDHPRLHGFLFIPAPNPAGTDFTAEDLAPVKSLFYLLKSILTSGKSGEFEFFGVASHLGGDFGYGVHNAVNPIEGAFIGVAKALRRELPNANSKAVDFPPKTSAGVLASTLIKELLSRDEYVEIGTLGGRGTLRMAEEHLSEEEPGIDLSRDDVILVTGGGSGITSDICLGLAERSKARFVLLGRTHLMANVAELARKPAAELAALKTSVAEQLKAKGERATPVQVEREFGKIQKAVEIHQTVERLNDMGCRTLYRSCDVTDANSLNRALVEVRRDLGPITGFIHAAGIEESKLIVDKTPESFDRVFDVKVLGAANLLSATSEDPLRFATFFASIAGRVGNAGQADYSAANDALAKIGLAMRHERGRDFPAVTIDWSAWADKGMATRGSVMTVLREAGVTAIPLNEGVRAFIDELTHGMRDAEILISGELGRLADPKLFSPRSAAPGPPAAMTLSSAMVKTSGGGGGQQQLLIPAAPKESRPLIDEILQRDDRTVVARLTLDPMRDPYLRDHAVDGVPYLPGVFGIEAFAEAAQLLVPEKVFLGARDVEYHLPAKVLRNQPLEVTIHVALAREDKDEVSLGCRLQSVFVNPKGERLGAPRVHFSGTVVFGDRRPDVPIRDASNLPETSIAAGDIYQRYFHGPSFQVLDALHPDEEEKRIVGVYAWPQAPLFGVTRGEFLTAPLVRELAYQTAGGFDLFVKQNLALPKGVQRMRFYDAPRPGERVLAIAIHRETRDIVSRYDVQVLGEKGRLLEELHGFELIRIKSTATPAPTDGVVYKSRWGHDFPLPLAGARAVIVSQNELAKNPVLADEALTAGERSDRERYRNEKRSNEFFAGRLAAKEAIALLTDRPVREARGIEIRRLETGEPAPRGKGTENVLVSITHTGDLALAAAARKGPYVSIGIDAELMEEKSNAFVTEAFADEEQKLLARLVAGGKQTSELHVLFWAVKEAVLKALGKGFALDVQDVRVQALEDDGRCRVKLEEPAQRCLAELGARGLNVQTWIRDGHAYALAWTTA